MPLIQRHLGSVATYPPDRKANPHVRWNPRDHLIRKSEDIDTGDFRAWLDAQVPLDRLKPSQYDEHRCGFVRHDNFLPPSNAVLERATAQALADVELYYRFYGYRDPHVQRFEELRDYQADSWPQPRRVIAKIEKAQRTDMRLRFRHEDPPDKRVQATRPDRPLPPSSSLRRSASSWTNSIIRR